MSCKLQQSASKPLCANRSLRDRPRFITLHGNRSKNYANAQISGAKLADSGQISPENGGRNLRPTLLTRAFRTKRAGTRIPDTGLFVGNLAT